MNETIEMVNTKKHKIRSDFILLLILIIQGLACSPLLILFLDLLFSEIPDFNLDTFMGDFFSILFMPYLLIFFMSFVVIFSSILVRSKWWTAIPFSLILFGLPVISWVIVFLAKQIAHLIYIPTVNDLLETKRILKMRVKPKKQYLSVYQEFLTAEVIEKPYYFSLWQTTIASFFGGFIGGGLMFSVNYKRVGENKKFMMGLILSFLLHFILLFLVLGLLNWIDGIQFVYILPFLLFIPVLCNLIYKEVFLERLQPMISDGEINKANWWSVIGVVLISLIFLIFCYDLIWDILRAIEESLQVLF